MPQIKVDLAHHADKERFATVLAETLQYVEASYGQEDCMISVNTLRSFDRVTKIVRSPCIAALEYFSQAFDGGLSYA